MNKLLTAIALAVCLAAANNSFAGRGHGGGHRHEVNRIEHHRPEPPQVHPPKPAPPRPAPPQVHTPKPAPPPQVHTPKPAPPPKPVPHHEHHNYRPGFFGVVIPRPLAREYYHSWPVIVHKSYYSYDVIPQQMQITLREDEDIEFTLWENTSTGYSWFARYEPRYCEVDIDHENKSRHHFTGAPGYAEVEIEGKRPGDTMVELIYARKWEWEKGAEPKKVIQIFVHIDPKW